MRIMMILVCGLESVTAQMCFHDFPLLPAVPSISKYSAFHFIKYFSCSVSSQSIQYFYILRYTTVPLT